MTWPWPALGVPLRPDEDAWPRFESSRRDWDAPHRRAPEQFGYAEIHNKPRSSSAERA